MAGGLAFHYFPGRSCLHRWDCRCKFPAVLAASFGLLQMRGPGLVLGAMALLWALPASGVPGRPLAREMAQWSVFLLFLFLVRTLSIETTFPWVGFSSVQDASLACVRLLLVLGFTILFTFVTSPREMQESLVWYLSCIPRLPARRVALMVVLTLRFLPLLLDQAGEVRLAHRARLGHRHPHLLRRAKTLVLPLVRHCLMQADALALALAARGYRDDLPPRLAPLPHRHLLALLGFLGAVAAGLTADRLGIGFLGDALVRSLAGR